MTASIESAISSRETRLMRMPRWFIETPSETEIVVNGTATPCAAAARRVGLRPERHRARRVLAVLADDADDGLAHVVVGHAGRAQEGAVRRAVEPVLDDGGAKLLGGRGHAVDST